jgi:hypothetical protein
MPILPCPFNLIVWIVETLEALRVHQYVAMEDGRAVTALLRE